jgi:hypothetical protein
VAPSLTALLGERIGARLISHAGSLTNLSKYPASTVQILGAEKALFRALKTKGNTPKVRVFVLAPFCILMSLSRSTVCCITRVSSEEQARSTRAAFHDFWLTNAR